MTETIDRAELKRVFELQRANRARLKATTSEERKALLLALKAEILRRADDIDQALYDDMRRPKAGARNIEIGSVMGEIAMAVENLDAWMAPEKVEPSKHFVGNDTYIMYEPRGVVLIFGPWNYPFNLVFGPVVSAVAAGNAAMVKPNELQPRVSKVTAEIIRAVFPENHVAAFEGGIPLAEALQELPFDHVFFTGSPAVGKRIMAAAAKHLTSVTLELGGKCPAIVEAGYDLAEAAQKVVGARFSNAGQLCLSVDHVWVPRAKAQAFTAELSKAIDAAFYVNGELQREKLPRIVDARNFARVSGYLTDATARGAKIAKGGDLDEADLTIAPTVLTDVPLDAEIMQDEIFGPLLPVLPYDSLDEVTEQIDATGKPLALYVFSDDKAFADQVLAQTSSGGVTVNNVLSHYVEGRLPFGGVNKSGIGRSRGMAGFRELSNPRSVFVQAK